MTREELDDLDEYQLEGYAQSIPKVLDMLAVPLVNKIGELLSSAFGQ